MRIFVTGGSGLVGHRLLKRLVERGDQAVLLTRRPDQAKQQIPAGVEVVAGNPVEGGPWMETLQACDAVVNLVGEGIFNRRWSADFKEEMRKSRVVSTQNVGTALSKNPLRADGSPKVLVSGSAVGF